MISFLRKLFRRTKRAFIGEVWVNDVISAREFKLEIAPRVDRKWNFNGKGDTYQDDR